MLFFPPAFSPFPIGDGPPNLPRISSAREHSRMMLDPRVLRSINHETFPTSRDAFLCFFFSFYLFSEKRVKKMCGNALCLGNALSNLNVAECEKENIKTARQEKETREIVTRAVILIKARESALLLS